MTWHVTVTDLKQWAYCPRVVFYQYCMPRLRPMTYRMEAGLGAHEEEKVRERRRTGQLYGLPDAVRIEQVRLQSETLGLTARIDLVLQRENQAWPVEYKLSRRTAIAAHFKLQLAAYALMLEEAWGVQAPEGFLYSLVTRKAERVSLSKALRGKAVKSIEEIRRTVIAERMPPPTSHRGRCINCEFRRFCNDVV